MTQTRETKQTKCLDCGKVFRAVAQVTAQDVWQAHSSMTGHRGPTDKPEAPRIVAECWTCEVKWWGEPKAGFDRHCLEQSIEDHRAAGHDVREVAK